VGKREGAKCGLHPLIHTRVEFTLAQDIVSCQDSLSPGLSDPSVEALTGQPMQ